MRQLETLRGLVSTRASFLTAVALVTSVAGAGANGIARATDPRPTLVDSASETVTGGAGNVAVSPFAYGATLSVQIATASSGPVVVNVPTMPGQTLSVLPDGAVAVTVPLPQASVPGDTDTTDADPATSDYAADQAGSAAVANATDDDTDPADQPVATDLDPTDYPSGDSVAPPTDGTDIVDAALQEAGNVTVISALEAPTATDANGLSVTASFTTTAGGVALVVNDANATYPLDVSTNIGFNADYTGDGTSQSVRMLGRVRDQASCGTRPTIVVSQTGGWEVLKAEFLKNPTPCANYYVLIPATGFVPKGTAYGRFLGFNNNPRVRAAGATFIPVAVLSWDTAAADQAGFGDAGNTFRTAFKSANYDYWAIDEAPQVIAYGPNGNMNTKVWPKFVALVAGLSGNDRQPHGFVENAIQYQDLVTNSASALLKGAKQYKRNLERVFYTDPTQTNFDWDTVGAATLTWAQETYTYCVLVCVHDATLKEMAQHTNQYDQHFSRLLFATHAPPAAGHAQDAVRGKYIPITNDWIGDHASYKTAHIGGLANLEKLASLQVYAARAWETSNTNDGVGVGLRWTDHPGRTYTSGDPAKLAGRIAASVKGAFSPSGSPVGACDPHGGTVETNCLPQLPRRAAAFTSAWNIFRDWGPPYHALNQSCHTTGGTDGQGGPGNHNFDSAQPLEGDYGLLNTTLAGATVQADEPTAADQAGIVSTVWYCWTATQTALDSDQCYPGEAAFSISALSNGEVDFSASPSRTTVWTGSDFGSLQSVVDVVGGVVFPATAGTTYLIQVANPSVSRSRRTSASVGRPLAHSGDGERAHSTEATIPRSKGGVPERPKGTGCKPVGSAYGGSNPPAPIHDADRSRRRGSRKAPRRAARDRSRRVCGRSTRRGARPFRSTTR